MANSRRHGNQHKTHVDVGHVVAGDQDRPFDAFEILAADNRWVRHDQRRRQRKQVVEEVANPAYRPTLRPAGISIAALLCALRLVQQAFQLTDGVDLREVRFAQVHLITVFQRAHQFDAVHRAQVEIAFELGVRRKRAGAAPGDAADEFAQAALGGGCDASRRESLLHRLLDYADLGLLRGCAGKVLVRPHQPASHLLKLRQLLLARATIAAASAAASRSKSAATGSALPPCSRPTTTQSRTSGC